MMMMMMMMMMRRRRRRRREEEEEEEKGEDGVMKIEGHFLTHCNMVAPQQGEKGTLIFRIKAYHDGQILMIDGYVSS